MKASKSILMLATLITIFSCSGKQLAKPGTYKNSQPYATQKDNAWSKNACGAFSMAYLLAENGQIKSSDVIPVAKDIYKKIKFDPAAGFGDYSDPFKIAKVASPFASSISFKMNLQTPASKGEKLAMLLTKKFNTSSLENMTSIETELKKNEYVIEIVVPSPNVNLNNPMKNPLHYVLTYWKNGKLYTLDPGRGKEELRENFINGKIRSWNFCNAGIFITPKK